MSKLSLDALQQRANQVVDNDLLTSISGGTENQCHDDSQEEGPSWWEIALGVAIIIATTPSE